MQSSEKPARHCAWCRHAETLNENEVICRYKGVITAGGHCFRYRYDPYKRIPPAQTLPDKKEYDFNLD